MATNPYTSQSASGYNSSPPPDDGTQTGSNVGTWSDVKTKLADVVKTLAEAIDTAVLAAFGKTINTDADENNAIAGSLAFTSSELTIATGAVTATRSTHTIDTEADGASDDLDSIATGSVNDFCLLIISAANTARTVVVKHEAGGAGQIHLIGNADISLDDDEKTIILQRRGADWYEIAGGASIATQTEMETATSTAVTVSPGRAQYHPGAAKFWLRFDGTAAGPITPDLAYNVVDVTDNGTGDYTINISTDFSTANFAAAGMARPGNDTTNLGVNVESAGNPAAGTLQIQLNDHAGVRADSAIVKVIGFGDQ